MGKLDGSVSVLCVPRARVEEFIPDMGAGYFHSAGVEDRILLSSRYIPRTEELENDPSFLQIIPYFTVGLTVDIGGHLPHNPRPSYFIDNSRTLIYARTSKGAEGRLYNKYSIGFGGHVESQDGDPGSGVVRSAFNCIAREIQEETGLDLNTRKNHVCKHGFIFRKDWEGVESVHLGIHYSVMVEASMSDIKAKDDDGICVLGCKHYRDLVQHFGINHGFYENWSKTLMYCAFSFAMSPS